MIKFRSLFGHIPDHDRDIDDRSIAISTPDRDMITIALKIPPDRDLDLIADRKKKRSDKSLAHRMFSYLPKPREISR